MQRLATLVHAEPGGYSTLPRRNSHTDKTDRVVDYIDDQRTMRGTATNRKPLTMYMVRERSKI